MYWFDPMYFVYLAPALLLSMWAQAKLQWTYSAASKVPVGMTGASAARQILQSAGINDVGIERVSGTLSDHYDPRAKVLRLSDHVFQGSSAASVGIAAHEVGHAIQDAHGYWPLVIRNAVVPVAGIGSNLGVWLIIGGAIFAFQPLIWVGIALFSVMVFFQLVNLPVEFDASARAKTELEMHGIVNQEQLASVRSVLNAAALTYVAATLSAVLTLLYYVMRFAGNRD